MSSGSELISEEEKQWLLSIPDVRGYFEFLKKQNKEEIALQLAKLMAALDRIDEESRYLILCMFRPFRVIQRNYQGVSGLLWKVYFDIKAIWLLEEAEYEDYGKGLLIREKRVSKFEKSYLMGYQEILQKEEKEKPQQQYY